MVDFIDKGQSCCSYQIQLVINHLENVRHHLYKITCLTFYNKSLE